MKARESVWTWMAGASCAALGVGLASLTVSRHRDITIALAMSARVAFVFFWPAYVGGALTTLFGDVFMPVKRRGRELGLAFAAAIAVHLGFVARLCMTGPEPSVRTFVIFGLAAAFALMLTLLSVDSVRRALPSRFWPPLRALAMNYIAFAFLLDFAHFPPRDIRSAVLYLPFLALAILGPLLRLAAWARTRANWNEPPRREPAERGPRGRVADPERSARLTSTTR